MSKDLPAEDNCWGALQLDPTPRNRQLRRSAPVLPLAFYRFEQVELSDNQSDGPYPPPTEAAIHMSRDLNTLKTTSVFNSGILDSATNMSSTWKTEWGPGQRLMRRNGVRKLFTRDALKPRGGFLEALRTLRRIAAPLRAEQFRHVLRAARAFGSLQEAASDPYPPANLTPLDVTSSAGKLLIDEIHFHFILAIAVYPPEHIVHCYGTKLRAMTMPETVREFITGSPEPTSDDFVVVDFLDTAAVHRPAYCLCVDHKRANIFLLIRGSNQYSDVATDVQCEIVSATRTHDGFERAASWFDRTLRDIVVFLRHSYPSYPVVLCGHSLGGGVATLLCMKWLMVTEIAGPPPARSMIRAYSYGAPCVCNVDLANNYQQHIVSVTNGRDIISRLSYGSVSNMSKVLLQICKATRTMRAETEADRAIRSSVKDAKRATTHYELLSADNLFNSVHDVAEYLESVLESSTQDRMRSAADKFLSRKKSQPLREDSLSPPVAASSPPGDTGRARGRLRGFFDMRSAREPLVDILKQLRELMDADPSAILVPAGRWYLFIPALHFIIAGRAPPINLLPGGAAMFDVSDRRLELCREMIFRRRAISDHFPSHLNFSLGCPLQMNMPETIAAEMERALSLGLDFPVQPHWVLPHRGLRHRRVKAKHTQANRDAGVKPTGFKLVMPDILRNLLPRRSIDAKESLPETPSTVNSASPSERWIDVSSAFETSRCGCKPKKPRKK